MFDAKYPVGHFSLSHWPCHQTHWGVEPESQAHVKRRLANIFYAAFNCTKEPSIEKYPTCLVPHSRASLSCTPEAHIVRWYYSISIWLCRNCASLLSRANQNCWTSFLGSRSVALFCPTSQEKANLSSGRSSTLAAFCAPPRRWLFQYSEHS